MVELGKSMDALVIGAGPAGLMAAEVMARAGRRVVVAEAKPSPARKFLMAGKSGLNLTKVEAGFDAAYGEAEDWLAPMLGAFGPDDVQDWARGLEQDVFTGSTGRVFPTAMKASPLLRAWLGRLTGYGVEVWRNWRWAGWDGDAPVFETPGGNVALCPRVTVLACGGASWARLGSDGAWAEWTDDVTPFQPSNVGVEVRWTQHMAAHFGAPIKSVEWHAVRGRGRHIRSVGTSRGEAILSANGLEGGGVYPLVPHLRSGARLYVDLFPDLTHDALAKRLPNAPKRGLAKVLKTTLRAPPQKIALAMEGARGLAIPLTSAGMASFFKAVPVPMIGLRPMDEAISTAGGLRRKAVDAGLMLRARPGVFACGEMLDWEAPTGGYLLTACFATGAWAGRHAADYRLA